MILKAMSVWVLLCLCIGSAWAAQNSVDRPVEVFFSGYLHSIDEVNISHGYITLSATTVLRWHLPPGSQKIKPGIYHGHQFNEIAEKLWLPGISVRNLYRSPVISNQALYIQGSGQVELLQHWWFSIKSHLDIRKFPLDKHQIDVTWVSPIYDHSQLLIKADKKFPSHFKVPDLPQWHESEGAIQTEVIQYPGGSYSGITFQIMIERKAWFYITKLIIPIMTLVYLSMTALWMRDDPTANRCVLPLTCLLTIVAFQWMIYSVVPKVDYQLLIDAIILTAYMTTSTVLMSIVLFNHCPFFVNRQKLRHTIRWVYVFAFPCVLALVIMGYLL